MEIPEEARGSRVGEILRMERQTERKRDGMGECTPSKYQRLATSQFVLLQVLCASTVGFVQDYLH